jgi:hypothetical protein
LQKLSAASSIACPASRAVLRTGTKDEIGQDVPGGIVAADRRSFSRGAMKHMHAAQPRLRPRDDSRAVLAGLFLSMALLPLLWALLAQLV